MSETVPDGSRLGPLAGVTVLEMARLAPGQMVGMLLADLGAEVLRIDEPSTSAGAAVRAAGVDRSHPAFAPNRGKRSIVLDLKTVAGLEVARALAGRSDVLLETFRPGVAERLGLGYTILASVNPRLVYCSLSGYGQTGPSRDMPGHDLNYISLAGIAALTGTESGEPPVIPGVQMADYAGGTLHAALGITVALLARERTGRGQYLDLAMMDGVMLLITRQIALDQIQGTRFTRNQDDLNGRAPHYSVYRTADDRFISVAAGESYFWASLCRALDLEDLIPLQHARGTERDQVFAALRQVFRTRTRDEWMAYLADKNTCVSPVLDLGEISTHPQVRAREMLVDVVGQDGSVFQQIGVSLKLSDTPARTGGPPPRIGQHTDAVLAELGYDAQSITALRAGGAVQ